MLIAKSETTVILPAPLPGNLPGQNEYYDSDLEILRAQSATNSVQEILVAYEQPGTYIVVAAAASPINGQIPLLALPCPPYCMERTSSKSPILA